MKSWTESRCVWVCVWAHAREWYAFPAPDRIVMTLRNNSRNILFRLPIQVFSSSFLCSVQIKWLNVLIYFNIKCKILTVLKVINLKKSVILVITLSSRPVTHHTLHPSLRFAQSLHILLKKTRTLGECKNTRLKAGNKSLFLYCLEWFTSWFPEII